MFEFQANRNDPVKLLAILERFTKWWFYRYDRPRDDYGVSEERLSKVSLPTPLRLLYGFGGEWPGGMLESVFSQQDHLIPFECLSVRDGKLVFVFENQGVWKCGTLLEGDDPPVWIQNEDRPWEFFCDSLAQFLVTFCLHELVSGAAVTNYIDHIEQVLQTGNRFQVPLWLNGPYPSCEGVGQLSFYIIQGEILRMDDCVAGQHKALEQSYPEFFPPNSRKDSAIPFTMPLWENPIVPVVLKESHLKMLIRKHEKLADYHSEKVAFYRDALEHITKNG